MRNSQNSNCDYGEQKSLNTDGPLCVQHDPWPPDGEHLGVVVIASLGTGHPPRSGHSGLARGEGTA